ncbi:RpiB/LacA/LacB family sugar-phosphate isomerase [Neolewinella lacunae]|uniref:RpiB/LacA/LacB family sugar-phosphate isomerase n=1 Tax=Neolewinella lacunae TaxID=1517758 RepID=A0A923T958_9BACT|nr:RpiB/LacA/LacB family sugar-phosphate isomerase [Neolewinella lacunae]MBC6996370.1 RpiB/LacA/LacB family sugar-phosphate isomerase [Neolewinella lacunae]MDN3636993.1 RpiB/LacA/LacB family sugar-phosphate isomerase [Neolewinella lacunae]
MTIGIATDHGGIELKRQLQNYLEQKGFTIRDFGAFEYDAQDDFPDFVIPLARAVGAGEVQRGIAVCGSGVGASIAANKINNVRACLITETYSARQGVEHDDLNMICLGGRVIGIALAQELVDNFLAAEYQALPRQLRRMGKIADLEK